MGNAESNAYQNHLSRFLPEEQSDIDGLFDTLSGSSGSAGAKNGKATKKTVTLAALQARQFIIPDISGMWCTKRNSRKNLKMWQWLLLKDLILNILGQDGYLTFSYSLTCIVTFSMVFIS